MALEEDEAAPGLLQEMDMSVERNPDPPPRHEARVAVERDVMAFRHPGTAAAGEQAHVDEAHHRAAVDRAAHILVRLVLEHACLGAPLAIRPEQQPPRLRREAPAREIAPAVPAFMIRVGPRAVGQPLRQVAQAALSATSFLVSAIALAGERPFGQTFEQFMIVWQR